MSLTGTKTLFERVEAVTTASQESFIEFQKEMLRQRILFMPIARFHHGISAAHTDEYIETILSAMRVALRVAR
jgi:glutamate-1-semialdehyde aminotransferase